MPVNSFDNYPMSWRPQLKKDKGSIHKELTDLLRKDIDEGVLLPGTKLPPQRELADFLDINVSTVSRAFKECEQEGLLSSAVGSGTFVAYSAISAEAMLPHSGKSGTIEMGSLSPVNLSTNILKKVLDELVNSTELDHLFEYHFPRKNSWHNEAGARLIVSSNLEKLLNESRAYVKRRNSIVDKALAGYEIHGSAECPFRWLVFSEGLDAGLLEDKLHKDHVQIYSMGRFAVESRGGVQAARICAVTPREEKDVITGIKKVKAMIEKM